MSDERTIHYICNDEASTVLNSKQVKLNNNNLQSLNFDDSENGNPDNPTTCEADPSVIFIPDDEEDLGEVMDEIPIRTSRSHPTGKFQFGLANELQTLDEATDGENTDKIVGGITADHFLLLDNDFHKTIEENDQPTELAQKEPEPHSEIPTAVTNSIHISPVNNLQSPYCQYDPKHEDSDDNTDTDKISVIYIEDDEDEDENANEFDVLPTVVNSEQIIWSKNNNLQSPHMDDYKNDHQDKQFSKDKIPSVIYIPDDEDDEDEDEIQVKRSQSHPTGRIHRDLVKDVEILPTTPNNGQRGIAEDAIQQFNYASSSDWATISNENTEIDETIDENNELTPLVKQHVEPACPKTFSTDDSEMSTTSSEDDSDSTELSTTTDTDQSETDETSENIALTTDEDTETEDEPLPWTSFPKLFNKFDESFIPLQTGVWDDYDIDPHERLEPMKVQSLEKVMSRKEWEKLKPLENRVQVGGQQFTIVATSAFSGSLFRAISNALTLSEKSHDMIRNMTISEIEHNWEEFVTEVVDYCDQHEFQGAPPIKPTASTNTFSKFKHKLASSSTGMPLFILRAAGMALHFQYILIDANDYNGTASVTSSVAPYGEIWETMFYFVRTGTHPETWFYQCLVPLGEVNCPTSGQFPLHMYDALQLDKDIDSKYKTSERSDIPSWIQKPEICFSLCDRTFFYQPTRTHDLWSILSEILFNKIAYAPKLYEMAMRMKLEEANYYHYSKFKKRRVYNGHGPCPKKMEQYKHSTKVLHRHGGDTEDLRRLAEVAGFSYTLLGMDANGNSFWKDVITSTNMDDEDLDQSGGDFELKKVYLFVRLFRNKQAFWLALKESGLENETKKSVIMEESGLRQKFYSKHRLVDMRPSVAYSHSRRSGDFSHGKSQVVGKLRRSLEKLRSANVLDSKSRSIAYQSISRVFALFGRMTGLDNLTNAFRKTRVNASEVYVRDNP